MKADNIHDAGCIFANVCADSIAIRLAADEQRSSCIASGGHFFGIFTSVSAPQYIVSFLSLSVDCEVGTMSDS